MKEIKIQQLLSEGKRLVQKFDHYNEELLNMKCQLKKFQKNQITSACEVIEEWKKIPLHTVLPATIMEPYHFENTMIYSSKNVIKSMDVERSAINFTYHIHSDVVKDTRFNYSRPSILLSVGFDRIILTDMRCRSEIRKVSSQLKLWSCCWSNIDYNT